MANPLFVVGAGSLEGDPEERAAALARALGLTLFEARARVRPPAPRVLASFAEDGAARRTAAALADEGFQPILLPGEACEDASSRVVVRGFERVPGGWQFESREGWRRLVEDAALRLVLRLSSTTSVSRTDTSTRRAFSLGKAVMTGGLSFTRKETVETTTTSSTTETSLRLVAEGHPTFEFREADLQFQGLGPALQPTRQANWQRFTADLRAVAPCFDDRLASRGGQVHVLGGVLPPERFLEVAVALLRRALLGA